MFHLSSLSKLCLHTQTQQQAVYKSVDTFLTPYAPILNAPYFYKLTSKSQTSPILLAKILFECPQHTLQACAKTCIILIAKSRLLLLSFTTTMLWWISRWKYVKLEVKPKEWSNSFYYFLSKMSFLDIYILKKITHSFFGAWLFLLVHIWFTPSEGPKGFINWFLKKSDHGSWIIKSVGPWGNDPLPWSMV